MDECTILKLSYSFIPYYNCFFTKIRQFSVAIHKSRDSEPEYGILEIVGTSKAWEEKLAQFKVGLLVAIPNSCSVREDGVVKISPLAIPDDIIGLTVSKRAHSYKLVIYTEDIPTPPPCFIEASFSRGNIGWKL
eukprot:gnl/Carplike_NY0171/4290_a5812_430.p1 GENE.gnl/Carplike_NY0171/4290_a5812_430~~gnl/Carplike_NY0171/4290_a5812_430.p1  ORF type:complete len:134 (-),score=12.24 gnl/Carplike_NY0171/4290_a5812_430:158-559(-)